MTIEPVSVRLQALSNTYKQTLQLIQRLQRLPSDLGSAPPTPKDDDARVELSAEIHQSLKDQEEELELLRQEWDDIPSPGNNRWLGEGGTLRRESSREQEGDRVASQIARLGEDLKM